ncbi:MAG: sodium:proton exchanger [Gaiellaceae bacterium]
MPLTWKGFRPAELAALTLVVLLTAASGLLHGLGAPSLVSFAAAALALAGLAWTVSFATEQVGERFGPGVTGTLQSTLGNLPEFFVVLFALSRGELVVARTAIVGSILANALLVLGMTIIAGALRSEDGLMRFGKRLPNDTATLLLVAVFIIVLVGISGAASDRASHHLTAISIVGAVCLLGVYATWLVFYLRADSPGAGSPRVGIAAASAVLAAAAVGAGFVSDWFVADLRPTIDRLSISDAFAGIVIVAIAGNAVENVVGIVLAWKRQNDLAISVIKNSVAQVAVFLFPLLVLCSLFFAHALTFSLAPVFIGALLLTALAMWQITGDGEASLFEGVALIALYVIVAVVALYE